LLAEKDLLVRTDCRINSTKKQKTALNKTHQNGITPCPSDPGSEEATRASMVEFLISVITRTTE